MIKVFIFILFFFFCYSLSESVNRASCSAIKYRTMGGERKKGWKRKVFPVRLSLTINKEKSTFVVLAQWHDLVGNYIILYMFIHYKKKVRITRTVD